MATRIQPCAPSQRLELPTTCSRGRKAHLLSSRGYQCLITCGTTIGGRSLRAADYLAEAGISTEVVDIRTLKPLDPCLILESVRKTGRLIAVDTGWTTCGFAGEIVALVSEGAFDALRSPPRRMALPDCPAPTTPGLSRFYYPRAQDLASMAGGMLGIPPQKLNLPSDDSGIPLDVPDPTFVGPF